jgi:hypothetical protein
VVVGDEKCGWRFLIVAFGLKVMTATYFMSSARLQDGTRTVLMVLFGLWFCVWLEGCGCRGERGRGKVYALFPLLFAVEFVLECGFGRVVVLYFFVRDPYRFQTVLSWSPLREHLPGVEQQKADIIEYSK